MTSAKLPDRFEADSYCIMDIPMDSLFYVQNADLTIITDISSSQSTQHPATYALSKSKRVRRRWSKDAVTAVWKVGDKTVMDLRTATELDCRWLPMSQIHLRNVLALGGRNARIMPICQCTIADVPSGTTVLLEEASLRVANDGTIWTSADTPVSFTDRGWFGTAAVERVSTGDLSLMLDAGTARRWERSGDVPSNAITFRDVQTITPPVRQNALQFDRRGWDLFRFLLRAR